MQKTDQKLWHRGGRRSKEEELGREAASSYLSRFGIEWQNLLLQEISGEELLWMSMEGNGAFIEVVRWEVSMKCGERLHFEVGKRTSIYYPISLCKVEEERDGELYC